MRTLRTLLFAAALAAVLPPFPSQDDVINLPQLAKRGPIVVTTTVDEDNDDGDCSLREAIKAVNYQTFVDACGSGLGNPEIYLPAGVYVLTLKDPDASNFGQESSLVLLTAMTIQGAGREKTIIDVESRSRIFYVLWGGGGLVTSLTLRNGRAPDAPQPTEVEDGRCNLAGGDGGAIYNQGVLALQDVAVRNSRAGAGAGKSIVFDPDCSPGDGPGGRGGGVYTTRSLELTTVLFEGNASGPGGAGIGGDGGAIYNAGGTVSATASIFSHNRAMEGGSLLNVPYRYGYNGGSGGAVSNGGIFAASSVSFFDNTAGTGGTDGYGSHAYGANGGVGGALNNEATGTAAIVACTFANNQAGEGGRSTWSGGGGSGGAISNYGQMEIVNSTITHNSAGNGAVGAGSPGNGADGVSSASNGADGVSYAGDGGSGGGIANGGTLRISATTVTENHAGKAGATKYGDPADDGVGGGIATAGAPVVRGLILAANVAITNPDCSGMLDSRGYNLISSVVGCTITGTTTGNLIGRSAKLGPLADNGGGTLTHLPASNSPVLNAAICQTVDDQPLLYDQRWVQRPRGSRCDIGAVER